jgi:hypothetical protein
VGRAGGTAVVPETKDGVPALPSPCQQVEVFCISVAIGQVSNPCSLPRNGSLQRWYYLSLSEDQEGYHQIKQALI